ncbi:MAG: D-glycero-alpha-D-manno-heptose-1,7-bisphosphate 7-phosphatase [Solitalea-like symbiont of Acarus siro]
MTKAIFLDRDGVLNQELGDYVCSLKDFHILDYNISFLQSLHKKGYIFIVITNQGGIALNRFSKDILYNIHDFMRKEYLKYGIIFHEIYYCPHHPSISDCLCRKPKSLMLKKAINRFNIIIEDSYMIGDRDTDVLAAENVGIKGIKVESNQNLQSLIGIIK